MTVDAGIIFGGFLIYLFYGRFYLTLRVNKIKPECKFHETQDSMTLVGVLWPFFMAYDYWKL